MHRVTIVEQLEQRCYQAAKITNHWLHASKLNNGKSTLHGDTTTVKISTHFGRSLNSVLDGNKHVKEGGRSWPQLVSGPAGWVA